MKRLSASCLLALGLMVGFSATSYAVESFQTLTGVNRWDKEKAFDGYTLISPNTGTRSYLLDMEGNIVHEWRTAFRPGLYAELLPNGVNRKTGKVEYRFGNPSTHGKGMAPTWINAHDQQLFGPHNVTWIGKNRIMIFDNGWQNSETNRSRVAVLDIKQNKIVWEYVTPWVKGTPKALLTDEDSIPAEINLMFNYTHRMYRYGKDYAGLKGKTFSEPKALFPDAPNWRELFVQAREMKAAK